MKRYLSILIVMIIYINGYTHLFVLATKNVLVPMDHELGGEVVMEGTEQGISDEFLIALIESKLLEEAESRKKQPFHNGLPLFSGKDIKRPQESRNIGSDINNFGNIMDGRGKGAIGVYKSLNGRYYSVFATAEEGYAALIQEIEIRKATTIPSRLHLSAFLGGWVLGKNGHLDESSFYYKYALATVGKDISILSISTEILAKIIMMGEGTLEAYQQGGVDLRHLIY